MKLKRCLFPGRKAMRNLDSILKSQRHYFAYKGPCSQSYGFSSREQDNKKGWVLKNWCFGRTDAEAEAPILWAPDAKNWHLERPWCWERLRQEEKGTTENEMVGWHYQLEGHELEQALGVGDGQGSLACCIPWGHKDSNMTEWLNWLNWIYLFFFHCLCFEYCI